MLLGALIVQSVWGAEVNARILDQAGFAKR